MKKNEPDPIDLQWQQWQKQPTPENNAALLNSLNPVIDQAAKVYAGQVNPLMRSRARALALKSLPNYDPARGPLRNHVMSHLQRLRRFSGQLAQGVRVPERVVFDLSALQRANADLNDTLGRDPTDEEISNHTGFSFRRLRQLRGAQSGLPEGSLSGQGEDGSDFAPAVRGAPGPSPTWLAMVYDDLSPLDKKVFEYTLGWNGQPRVERNEKIAALLRRSPGWVSQRKLLIQRQLDQEVTL